MKIKKHSRFRTFILAFSALFFNANVKGFFTGTLFTGASKNVCVPVFNCYSCPGAIGSCPIGALQAVANSRKFNVSFYVVGFLTLVGVSVGRLFCGWACPFGWFQDLIYKIPVKKRPIIGKIGRILSYLKYVILAVFVLFLPFAVTNNLGLGEPLYCKWLCPAGTFQASFPLLLTNPSLREILGWLYSWKVLVLVGIAALSTVTSRPFCRFFCPLGAFYAVFQRFSLYRLTVNPGSCTNCGACDRACKLDLTPQTEPNSPDCIRCLDCVAACPTKALTAGFRFVEKPKSVSCQTEK